ncbi:uncharacterized protein K452DRAFT_301122 [Aplosporella prunicola CBS 121167]|uniref:HORMA domain-containing protein n=1 Tax=Aplosporella prunicola CBS 121167 TaxID=1176127 RepID=A0A6A6B4N3_9PEZI|nr:uncharacterized protein K452DRAFT_301122 [Aplosporella prunicola CBS 121167]KAF2138598.1 hypothetical protein K452DRAFT_301122 [Aplosporella prunicola CBS 121167]
MAAEAEKKSKVSKTTKTSTRSSKTGEKPAKKSSSSSKKAASSKDDPTAKTHKLALKGSSKIVSEFFEYSIHTILFQRGVYPAEDFTAVKKYGLTMMVSADDQVKAYIKKIMTQLSKWMQGSKINKLVIVVTSRETGQHVERWQFDVDVFSKSINNSSSSSSSKPAHSPSTATTTDAATETDSADAATDAENATTTTTTPSAPEKEKTEAEIQSEIQSLFRQITASVTFLPMLDGNCTFNVLVYADADSDVPVEWGDSDAKEIENGEKVQLRSFSTSNHRVDTLVSYRLAD